MTAIMMAMLSSCIAFTSCSDDDEDDNSTPAAELVAGTYTDNMTCTVMGSESTYENVTVTINKVTDATVDVVLPGFGSGVMTLPSITLSGVKVSGNGTSATIDEQTFTGTVTNASGAEKSYTCTIAGSHADGKLTLNYSIQYGSMPMAMVCKFPGNVLTIADKAEGSYTNNMTCTVMGQESTYENVTVAVAKASESTVNITLPGFGSGAMTLPAITLSGVAIAEDGTIAEQTKTGTVTNASGEEKTYTCTIAGSYVDGKLTLNYSLQYGAMPMAMVCAFTSTKA